MRWFRLCAALLAALTLASAQNPTGKWIAKFSSDDEAREIVLALNVESGGKVTGYVLAPQYEDRIVEGTASGGKITFVAEREANNNTRRRSNYSAVLEGDKLKLTMPTAGNRPPQVIEFTRTSAEAPAPLPPPPPKIALAAPAAVRDNGLARTPPMGWNSWNKFRRPGERQDGARDGRRHGQERHEGRRLRLRQHRRHLGRRRATPRAIFSTNEVSRHEGAGRLRPRQRAEDRHLLLARSQDLRRLRRQLRPRRAGRQDLRRLGHRLPEVRLVQRRATSIRPTQRRCRRFTQRWATRC